MPIHTTKSEVYRMKLTPRFTPLRTAQYCLCCILSLVALMTSLGAEQDLILQSNPFALVLVLAAFAMGLALLYYAWLRLKHPFSQGLLWVLAVVFAALTLLGKSFDALGTTELITQSKLKTLVFFIGRIPLYYAVMHLLSRQLQNTKSKSTYRFGALPYTMGLFICWLPYWIMTFPGTLSNDSITQIKEILGALPMSNGNPIFQTWLIRICLQISNLFQNADVMIALYCGLQALLMAWLLGSLLSKMGRSAAPHWLVILSAVFYALCPIFPSFAFCVGKDTNFAMAVLFFSLSIWRILQPSEGKRISALQIISLCVAAVLCVLLRNPGVYLALITLVILLIWTLIKRNRLWLAPVSALIALVCIYGALHGLIIPTLDIAPMPETENYSLPLQQVARITASAELTDEEKTAIDGVLDLSKLKEEYNPELSDPVKNLWRGDAAEAQKSAFWRTWSKLLIKHPTTAFSATFANTYGYIYPGFISEIKPTLLIGDQSTRTANLTGLLAYSVNSNAAGLKAFTNTLAQFPPYRILISPGLYGWITLFTAACLLHKKDKRYLIAAVPAIFTLAGCTLSAVNGYFRYAMPLYLIAPFLLWLCTDPFAAKAKPQVK